MALAAFSTFIASLEWTVVYRQVPLFPPLEALAASINGALSLEDGQDKVARMLLCMMLSYPLALPLALLPFAHLRHAYAAATGILFVQFVFGLGWVHLLLPSAAVYLATAALRAAGAVGPGSLGHWVAALLSFSYLIFRHLSRDGVKSNNIDDSTLTMVLVVKLYTLCYNLYDADVAAHKGEQARLEAAAKAGDAAAAQAIKLQPGRAARALRALPDPLEFLGYVFNFSTVFVGPAFEVSEYLAGQRRAGTRGAMAASRYLPAVWKFVQGVAWFAVTSTAQAAFPTDGIYLEAVRPGSTAASTALVMVAALICSRYKYYACWKLAEGAAVLSGFGFREADKGRRANLAVADFEGFTGLGYRAWVQRALTPKVDVLGLGIAGLPDWEGVSNVSGGP